jgi:hypothetical protein
VKETRLTGIEHRCRLLRHDVEELILTTCRGIDEKYLKISTEQGNVVTSGKTLPELEEEAGHPQRLNNLDITVIDFNLDRQVHIKLNSRHAFYQVKGVDPTWTNGRFAELNNILQKTRSHVYWVYNALATISSSALAGLLTAFHVNLFTEREALFIGAGSSMFCLVVALLTLTIRASRNLILLQNINRAPRDPIQLVSLGIAVIGLLMSAIQLGLAIL